MSTPSREWFDDSMKGDPGREVVVFTEALKVPPRERAAFLDRVCDGDEKLRHKVEALLRAHDRLGHFLEEPAINATLVPLLRKIATPASPYARRRGHRKTESGFQPQPRKRKGKINGKSLEKRKPKENKGRHTADPPTGASID